MIKGVKYEQEMRSKIRKIIAAHITPNIDTWEENATLPVHDLVRTFATNNLFGFRFPTIDGGQNQDIWAHLIFAEEIGAIKSGGISMALTIQGDMVAPMLDSGMKDPKARAQWLRPVLLGKKVYSHAISEETAGSDPSAITTTATPTNGGYKISGAKHCISLAPLANAHCILARLKGRRFPFNMVLLMVDAKAPGVTTTSNPKMMGNHACPTGDVFFNDVFVPTSARIGDEGMGFILQMNQFTDERVISSARAVSSASYIIEETIEQISKRKIYGGTLLDLQTIAHRLANLKSQASALRKFVHQTIARWKAGKEFETSSSIVKLLSNRLARDVGRECVKLLGAQAYCADSKVGRFFRDGRLFAISTGSDETMQIAIARTLDHPIDKTLPPISEHPLPNLSPTVQNSFKETLTTLHEHGFLKDTQGQNWFETVHALIEASCVLPNPQATSLLTHLDVSSLLAKHAKEQFFAKWQDPILTGKSSFCLAITETQSGSDFAQLATHAKEGESGQWCLNGEKNYITNGAIADGYAVLASTPSPNPMTRFTLFAVPKDNTVKTTSIDTFGNSGCLGKIRFENTKLTPDNILGHLGQGHFLIQTHLNKERYFIALRCFALGKASLARTVQELKKRTTFNAPLSNRQALQFRFSDCLSELTVLRSLLEDLKPKIADQSAKLAEVAAAKIAATETLERIADFEIQIAGAQGYQQTHPASCLYRDGLGLSIAGGSDGILRELISRTLIST